MDKKWKNLIIVVFFLLFVIAGLFLLQNFPTSEKTTITVEEGFEEINAVLSQNSLSFERLQKAEIILIEDGKLVNDFSESSFSNLQNGLQALKAKFQSKENSSDKEALVQSIDLYLEVLELERKEKELYGDAVALNEKVSDLKSGCENKQELQSIADRELEFSNSLSELNQKTSDFLLDFIEVERADLLLLDLNPSDEFESAYDFSFDVYDIDYLCSVLFEGG